MNENLDQKKAALLTKLLMIPVEEWEWSESKRMKLFLFPGEDGKQKDRVGSIYINNMDVDLMNITYFQTHLNGLRVRLILHKGLHIFQIGNVEIANWNGENKFVLFYSQKIVLKVTKYVHEQKRIADEKEKLERELNPPQTMEQIEAKKIEKLYDILCA